MLPLVLAAVQAATPVPSDPLAFDLRCFLVTAALRGSTDEAARAAGEQAALYYFGRIDGRMPGLDLEAALTREALQIRDEDRPALLTACGEVLTRRGRAVAEAGRRMQERAGESVQPQAEQPVRQ